ncbi:MAG: hypothetical protein QNJ73_13705 [Gammaproteobacteria bacterium]|nr:hypothetical protein [Gammaproteobacteria bacterium]
MSRGAVLCLSLVLLLMSPVPDVEAKDRPWRAWPTGKRFNIAGGAFWPQLDTKVRLDASDGTLGTEIDFESNLGMENNKALAIVLARWRISRRNAIDFAYFDLNRSGLGVSNTIIRFGDATFPANLPLNSFFDSEIYSAAWSYSFIHNPSTEIAFQIGLNLQDIAVGIQGPTGIISEDADFAAPLPTFGLSGRHFFNDKFGIVGRAGIFAIEIDLSSGSFEGEVVNLALGLEWDAFKHVGFSFGLEYFHVDVDVEDTDWSGSLRYDWWGPVAAVRFFF